MVIIGDTKAVRATEITLIKGTMAHIELEFDNGNKTQVVQMLGTYCNPCADETIGQNIKQWHTRAATLIHSSTHPVVIIGDLNKPGHDIINKIGRELFDDAIGHQTTYWSGTNKGTPDAILGRNVHLEAAKVHRISSLDHGLVVSSIPALIAEKPEEIYTRVAVQERWKKPEKFLATGWPLVPIPELIAQDVKKHRLNIRFKKGGIEGDAPLEDLREEEQANKDTFRNLIGGELDAMDVLGQD